MKNMPTYEELLSQISVLKKQVKYLGNQTEKAEKKYEQAQSEIKDLTLRNKELIANYNWILEQLKLSKKKIYGSSAEKIAEDYGQLNLFNEAELERQPLEPEPKLEEITYRRRKSKKRNQNEIYGDLPVEEIVYDIPEEEKTCEKCGSEMSFMKYEIRKELKIVPAKVSVVEHKKAVYVCKNCDKNGIEANFKTAKGVPALIEKSLASPSMLAYIMNQKFTNAMPLYRQEQEFKRMGVNLTRQTMANWMIKGANLLKPIYEEMRRELVSKQFLHADETPLEVLNEPGKEPGAKSYMWVYKTGQFEGNPIVLYDYEVGRSGEFAKKFLSGFSGYLHCDGWTGYDKVENAKRCGCWAHLRRYFLNALDVQEDKTDYSTIAGQGFLMIEKIFSFEKPPKGKPEYTLDEIKKIRKNKSADKVKKFFEFCEENQGKTLPKSMTGRAIGYALNQRVTLEVFLENPKIELTNNTAERAIKPFVIGRKNWLFCNTPDGARASAIIYSIIETAKANNLNPLAHLEQIFEKLQKDCAPTECQPEN